MRVRRDATLRRGASGRRGEESAGGARGGRGGQGELATARRACSAPQLAGRRAPGSIAWRARRRTAAWSSGSRRRRPRAAAAAAAAAAASRLTWSSRWTTLRSPWRRAMRCVARSRRSAAGAAVVLAIALAAVVVTGHGGDAQAAAPNAAVVDPLEACGGRGMPKTACGCDAWPRALRATRSSQTLRRGRGEFRLALVFEHWHGLRSEQPAASWTRL